MKLVLKTTSSKYVAHQYPHLYIRATTNMANPSIYISLEIPKLVQIYCLCIPLGLMERGYEGFYDLVAHTTNTATIFQYHMVENEELDNR